MSTILCLYRNNLNLNSHDLYIFRAIQELLVDPEKSESSDEMSTDAGDTNFPEIQDDSCGCVIWDEQSHSEHMEAFYYAARCSNECALEKVCQFLSVFVYFHLRHPPISSVC